MQNTMELYEEVSNPLDCVEEILIAHDWVFDRPHTDEMRVQISGRSGIYNMHFLWEEDFSTLQCRCEYDLTIPAEEHARTALALMEMNNALWLGHFKLDRRTGRPSFRHSCLMRGMTHISGIEPVEDLVDVALAECERFFSVFDILAHNGDDAALAFALMDQAGEA